MRVIYNCPAEAVATVTVTDTGHQFELHPNLVREQGGWLVFALPESSVAVALPRSLHGGLGLC